MKHLVRNGEAGQEQSLSPGLLQPFPLGVVLFRGQAHTRWGTAAAYRARLHIALWSRPLSTFPQGPEFSEEQKPLGEGFEVTPPSVDW